MEINKHSIEIKKIAKIVTYGKLSNKTKIIWFVAHGYGYLAESFIKRFKDLDENEHFVIVPEALNRFYINGLSGKVGANWMTTEERISEIEDYIKYLDDVYVMFNLHTYEKLVVLGFSQGGATMARWFQQTKYPVKMLVFWGASIPDEVLEGNKIHQVEVYNILGDEDEFFQKEHLGMIMQRYLNAKLKFSQIFYKGGHNILTEPLMQFINLLKLS